jgi:hypothetical protein
MAAAQVVAHLPPARLAGAVVGGRGDVIDEQLVERLQWVQVRLGGGVVGKGRWAGPGRGWGWRRAA